MRKLVLLIATGFASGYAPFAPGTVGSLVGLLLYVPLAALTVPAYLAGWVLISAAGVWASTRAEVLLGAHDDSRITIDEIAGMLLALAFLPARPEVIVVGFLLFRLFDIWKPPPCRWAERLPRGWGVMADDWIAGLYANLIGQVLWRGFAVGGLG